MLSVRQSLACKHAKHLVGWDAKLNLSCSCAIAHRHESGKRSIPILEGTRSVPVDCNRGETYTRFNSCLGGVPVKRNRGILLVNLFVSICIVGLLGGVAFGQTGNGTAEPPNTGGLFTDVPRDHWAYADLEYLAARGIITGLPGGRFEGDTALSRYDAAAMISRAIKYMQNNSESVTFEDLDVVKDLFYKVSGDVTILQSQMGTSQGADVSTLENRVSQTELEIAELNTQIQDDSSSVLAKRVQANFFISLTALLVGIIGIALATLGL